jgi:hypothetical protein
VVPEAPYSAHLRGGRDTAIWRDRVNDRS